MQTLGSSLQEYFHTYIMKFAKVKVCEQFDDHFCAFWSIYKYIWTQQSTCMKPTFEKYFKGLATFRTDFFNLYPHVIDKERKNRTLLLLQWEYQSNDTTIYEEKLVYDSKDLLAWLGGAFGIFVGYSFFDFARQIVEIAFYVAFRKR